MMPDHILALMSHWPKTKTTLALSLNCSEREVELAIRELRLGGAPIASGANGYWLAERPDELDGTIAQMYHRLREQGRTLAALRRTRARMVEEAGRDPNGQRLIFSAEATA